MIFITEQIKFHRREQARLALTVKCEYRLLNPCSHCLPIHVIMYARRASLDNSGRRKASNSVSFWHGAPWFSTFWSSVIPTRRKRGMECLFLKSRALYWKCYVSFYFEIYCLTMKNFVDQLHKRLLIVWYKWITQFSLFSFLFFFLFLIQKFFYHQIFAENLI